MVSSHYVEDGMTFLFASFADYQVRRLPFVSRALQHLSQNAFPKEVRGRLKSSNRVRAAFMSGFLEGDCAGLAMKV
jgi:hypothetical protein